MLSNEEAEHKTATAVYTSLDQFLPYYFRFINPIIHEMKASELQLHENQIKVLMAVSKKGTLSPGEISSIFMIPKTSLTTIIRSLISLNLVEKKKKAGDSRTFTIELTSQGKAVLEKKRLENLTAFSKLFSDLEESEAALIVEGFETMKRYFSNKGYCI